MLAVPNHFLLSMCLDVTSGRMSLLKEDNQERTKKSKHSKESFYTPTKNIKYARMRYLLVGRKYL